MAATCPIDFDIASLRESVRAVYTRVADDPTGDFHFHRGVDYAVERLGYDRRELEALPPSGDPALRGRRQPAGDGSRSPGRHGPRSCLRCGHGPAAGRATRRRRRSRDRRRHDAGDARAGGASAASLGRTDRPSPDPRRPARGAARRRRERRRRDLERRPQSLARQATGLQRGVPGAAPRRSPVAGGRRRAARAEPCRRVEAPISGRPASAARCRSPSCWSSRPPPGLRDGRVQARFDCFAGTSAEAKVSADLRIGAVNFSARKPGSFEPMTARREREGYAQMNTPDSTAEPE